MSLYGKLREGGGHAQSKIFLSKEMSFWSLYLKVNMKRFMEEIQKADPEQGHALMVRFFPLPKLSNEWSINVSLGENIF